MAKKNASPTQAAGKGAPADAPKEVRKVVATNRRAFHEYHVLERVEAGMQLLGSEVKSLRAGHCTISDSYATIDREEDEAWLHNLQIPEYSHRSTFDSYEPKRRRRLLLHKAEIRKLRQALQQKGFTLVPLSVYFKNGYAKVELGLCQGKKLHDKRQSLKEKDARREIARRVAR